MVKGIERGVRIDAVQLERKQGGRSGTWRREAEAPALEAPSPPGPLSSFVERGSAETAHSLEAPRRGRSPLHEAGEGPGGEADHHDHHHHHAPAAPLPPGLAAVAQVELRTVPLSVDDAHAAVAHGGAGAVVSFVGAVRDHSEGHPVTRLEYEAYPAMAVAEMRRIAEGIAAEVPGVRLAVQHRVGELGVGDLAVVCAASAPHRGEAFRASRLLIDRIKAQVPIWKREHGPDGAYWVGWRDARCEGHD
ncbi:MAG: molybdenum cofactor biosynthesis protein MoaE [Myxococcales bacterium]|nr:MAG: molybdenum cofactor biosynthesis protein MoaE [Myxococcales bacterium]